MAEILAVGIFLPDLFFSYDSHDKARENETTSSLGKTQEAIEGLNSYKLTDKAPSDMVKIGVNFKFKRSAKRCRLKAVPSPRQ